MSTVLEAVLCVPVFALWFGPAIAIAALALRAALARGAGEARGERPRLAPPPFGVARLRRA
jgi:hypothetical protein